MQVETYEEIEVDAETGTPECDEEAARLIAELGLTGQQELLCKDKDGKTSRNVYPMLTAEQMFVFSQLFPQKTSVERYKAGPIPVRVLQVVAHGRELFEKVEVWHKESTDVELKDPLLIGCIGDYDFQSHYKRFILARWGEALVPYSELVEIAAKRYREKFVAACQAAIAAVTHAPVHSLCSGKFTTEVALVEK